MTKTNLTYDPDSEPTVDEIKEGKSILKKFKRDYWAYATVIDSTESDTGDGYHWDSLMAGYALGRASNLSVVQWISTHWYDELYGRSQ